MGFCRELRLLIWKNNLLRRRHKTRTILEICWPLLMILLILALYSTGEKEKVPNCHLKPKAMPSAGEILLLQTFFCSLSNMCETEESVKDCYKSSIASNLGKALINTFKLAPSGKQTSAHKRNVKNEDVTLPNLMKDFLIIESLIEGIRKLDSTKLHNFDKYFHKNHSSKYTYSSENLFFDDHKHRSDYSFNPVNEPNDITILSRIKRKIYGNRVVNSFQQWLTAAPNKDIGELALFLNKFGVLDYLLCGPTVQPVVEQLSFLLKRRKTEPPPPKPPDNAVPAATDSYTVINHYHWDKDTSDFCNNFLRNLDNAPVINRIMTRINDSLNNVFKVADVVKNGGAAVSEIDAMTIEDIVNKYKKTTVVREIVKTKMGKELLRLFGNETGEDEKENDIGGKVKNFQKILDEAVETWKKIAQGSDKGFANFFLYLECFDSNRVIPVKSESEGVKQALKWQERKRLWGLIVFPNVAPDADKLPPSVAYKIRSGTERAPDTNIIYDRIKVRRLKRHALRDVKDVTGGFAHLQNMIEKELLREYTGKETMPGIYLRQMPYPCHVFDALRELITNTFPLFTIISYAFLFCLMAKKIIREKEVMFRGMLKVFGVGSPQYWFSWFVDGLIPLTIIATIASIMLVKGGLIPNSDVLLVWLFLFSFALPTITLAFLLSSFFSHSSFAMAVCGMFFFLIYLPYTAIKNHEDTIEPSIQIYACLISNVAFGLGCTWIANMEEIGHGAKLAKMYYIPVQGDPISMGLIIFMFVIDSIIYFLLAIYFDNILSANKSVKLSWYYCVKPSYWKKPSKESPLNSLAPETAKDPRYFEPEPQGLTPGIEIVNLTKDFGSKKKKKRAVNQLNMNFYENQITSFLGHNGAGKTTAISMMIGLLPITEGKVRIYGVDIRRNPHVAIKHVGICAQENVLLDDLTAVEHFIFFSKLKGQPSETLHKDLVELITDLKLGKRAKQPVRVLSGGMKRKVCVALAFIGGSRTVFLDEPTAGVDPYSRRAIWDMLIKYKKGRTIILTTHHLDEADLLGDRIAIISAGELQCCGSSTFLKTNLGRGYYLTIESKKRPEKVKMRYSESKTTTRSSPQIRELEILIKRVMPEAEFREEIGTEIVFVLPPKVQAKDYDSLFRELDRNKERLNFSSYGVTDTSLEEVFMKILLEAEEKQQKLKTISEEKQETLKTISEEKQPENQKPENSGIKISVTFQKKSSKMTRNSMLKQHFIALIIKRFFHHMRNFWIILFEILLPALFIAAALTLTKPIPPIDKMPPKSMDMSIYNPSIIFYSNDFPGNSRVSSYENVLLGPYGFGTKCILHPEQCTLKSIPKGSLIASGVVEDSKKCTCPSQTFTCESPENMVPPPSDKMSTGDSLYNLTGLNLANWLLTTQFDYPDRLGGISFGHFAPLSSMSLSEFLTMFQQFFQILTKVMVNDKILIDPDVFTNVLMSVGFNQAYGNTLFQGRDLTDNIIVWFNNLGKMSSLAMMNGVTNLVLRASLPDGMDPSNYSITFINHPLPITKPLLDEKQLFHTNLALVTALSIIWALSFIPAMYAAYLVDERVAGLKHLQIVSGVNRVIYWSTNLIWDLLSFTISMIGILMLYFMFQMYEFVGKDTIGAFITLLMSYGFANISFAYFVSFMFNVASTAFIFVACWNNITGMVTLLTTFTLTLITSLENPYHLKTIFMVFPQFCFAQGLISMSLEDIKIQSLENAGVLVIKSYFRWDFLTKYIVVMIIVGILFLIVTLLIEYNMLRKFIMDPMAKEMFKRRRKEKEKKKEQNDEDENDDEDDDVKRERERVESGKAKEDQDLLIMNSLIKIYGIKRMETPAVNRISIGIKRGECFGLLGLNGAGKTTLFKILTGHISPTEGEATVAGQSIRKNPMRTKYLVGYCPQNNALDPYLTVQEHLSLFCSIRGLTGGLKKREVTYNLELFGLTGQKNKITKVLSGGNKRKVNTAIAHICNPQLILLDEPTSGMDALSRRLIWNRIQKVVLDGRCVVLTSHSMEECQALCTQISVMVKGKFTCYGSSQHLKSKFDEGYSVIVRVWAVEAVQEVIKYLNEHLPGSTLDQIHHIQIKYKLSPEIFIGTAFTVLNEAKENKLIEEYSISQTTLESIFIKLAMKRQPQEVVEIKSDKKIRCCDFKKKKIKKMSA